MIELIMTIVIIGVIASVATPKFFRTQDFETRFAKDDFSIALNYARELAVVSGCPVRVQLTSIDYQLFTNQACSGNPAAFSVPVKLPSGDGNFQARWPTGFSILSPAPPFTLDFSSQSTVKLNTTDILFSQTVQIKQGSVDTQLIVHGLSGMIE